MPRRALEELAVTLRCCRPRPALQLRFSSPPELLKPRLLQHLSDLAVVGLERERIGEGGHRRRPVTQTQGHHPQQAVRRGLSRLQRQATLQPLLGSLLIAAA